MTIPGYEDGLDSPQAHADKVYKAMEVTGTGEILLALAWTFDDALSDFQKFPYVFSMDDTQGTNAEKRPLVLFVGQTSWEKLFIFGWAFMPNKKYWAYEWLVQDALKVLLPSKARERTLLILSDEDERETLAIDNNIGCPLTRLDGQTTTFPNAARRLCSFHKVFFGFSHGKFGVAGLRADLSGRAKE